jgi:hypothetical protein
MVHTTSITDIIDVLLLLLTVLIYYLLRISHPHDAGPRPVWSVIRFVRLPIDPLQTSFVRGYFSLFLALLFLFQTPLLTPHPRPDTTRQRPRGTTARASTANISPFSSVLPHNRKSPLRPCLPCLPCRSLNSASPPTSSQPAPPISSGRRPPTVTACHHGYCCVTLLPDLPSLVFPGAFSTSPAVGCRLVRGDRAE